jgi:hypothetical protein
MTTDPKDFLSNRELMLSALFWVKPREAAELVKFEVTKARQKIFTARRKNSRLVVLKGRQMKITTGLQYDDLLTCLMYPNHRHGFAAQDDVMTVEMFQNYRNAYTWMEKRWQLSDGTIVEMPTAIEDSKHHMLFDNGSGIHAGTAGSKGFGRGITLNSFHGADLGYWDEAQAKIFLAGIEGSMSLDASMVIEGTPSGEGTIFHRYYRNARRRHNNWQPLFLHWWLESEYSYPVEVDKEKLTIVESELINKYDLTLGQIAWRRLKYANLAAGIIDEGEINPARAEYPENDVDCWIFSGETIFRQPELKELLDEAEEPYRNGEWDVWEDPDPNGYYIISGDSAEGLHTGDFSAATIWECSWGMRQVARLHGKYNTRTFAQLMAQFGRYYQSQGHDAIIAVERNTYGLHVLDILMSEMGYTELYWYYDFKNPSLSGRPGWPTTTVTKPRMINDLGEMIASGEFETKDSRLLEELMSFRQLDGTKTGAPKGSHDDLAITTMIANQVRYTHPRMREEIQTPEEALMRPRHKLGMMV